MGSYIRTPASGDGITMLPEPLLSNSFPLFRLNPRAINNRGKYLA